MTEQKPMLIIFIIILWELEAVFIGHNQGH